MKQESLGPGRSSCTFTFEEVERAVKRWNSLGPRRWLVPALHRSSDPEAFAPAYLGDPDTLAEILEICPEAIEEVPAVARALTALYRQAGRQSRKDADAKRAQRILARLIPKHRGGRIAVPRFIIAQVGRHCYGTACELKAALRGCGGDVDRLLATEQWLGVFCRCHFGNGWRCELSKWLDTTPETTPYNVGLEVAARILSVHPETVRRSIRQFPGSKKPEKPLPTFWADLPISSRRPRD